MNWFKFEKALKMLMDYFPSEPMKKPVLFHSIRVWTYLWNNNYSEDIQIAWLLHDALEDTDIQENVIEKNFWIDVLNIVKANSKNLDLPKDQILENIIKKCVLFWENALIVKMTDVYDNFKFYLKENNTWEIERCKKLSKLIKKYKKNWWSDDIFKKIEIIISYNKL